MRSHPSDAKSPAQPRRAQIRLVTALLGMVLVIGPGCLGLALKDPGQPMSQRDLGLRVRTREFAGTFSDTVSLAADSLHAQTTNQAARTDALRWKLGAARAARDAVLRTDPVLALADAWALSRQMAHFLEAGAGTNLFGPAQPVAAARARELETNAMALARAGLAAAEFRQMEKFVTDYAGRFPVTDLSFQREPVAAHWPGFEGATQAFTAGTTPEAVADLGSRLELAGRQVREEVAWRLELGSGELDATLKRTQQTAEQLDAALQRIAAVAEMATPAFTSAVAMAARELQSGFLPSLQRLETQWTNTLVVLREEREAVTRDLSRERAELIKAVDEQRAALMKEVDRTALAVTQQASAEVRGTLRELALYAWLCVALVLGLPFVFGFLAGRATARARANGAG